LAAWFGSKFICRQTYKRTLKDRKKQKNESDKSTLFPEILKTTCFLEKKCTQEFPQNKTNAIAMA